MDSGNPTQQNQMLKSYWHSSRSTMQELLGMIRSFVDGATIPQVQIRPNSAAGY
jgi:hypothetical protein